MGVLLLFSFLEFGCKESEFCNRVIMERRAGVGVVVVWRIGCSIPKNKQADIYIVWPAVFPSQHLYNVCHMFTDTDFVCWQKKSREESHGTESGVEILENKPYFDGPGGNGQYTYKIYHIGSHLPGNFAVYSFVTTRTKASQAVICQVLCVLTSSFVCT